MRELYFRGQTRRFGEKVRNYRGEPLESNWVYGSGLDVNGELLTVVWQETQVVALRENGRPMTWDCAVKGKVVGNIHDKER